MMKKYLIIGCVSLIVLGGVICFTVNKKADLPVTKGVEVVPTMDDNLSRDASWCSTFQLVWNDMKNEIVKQDVVFSPQIKMVENLNKESFTEDMLSDEYYFKIYGFKNLELKEKKKGIQRKIFDE